MYVCTYMCVYVHVHVSIHTYGAQRPCITLELELQTVLSGPWGAEKWVCIL